MLSALRKISNVLKEKASFHKVNYKDRVRHCESLLRRSKKIDEFGECTLLAHRLIAQVFDVEKEYEKSLPNFRKAASISEKIFGEEHVRTVELRFEIAFAIAMLQLDGQQKVSEIMKLGDQIAKKLYPEHRLCFEFKLRLVQFLEERGAWDEALELIENTHKACEETFGEQHHLSLKTRQRLFRTICRVRDFPRLKEFCERSIPIFEKHAGPDSLYFTWQCE